MIFCQSGDTTSSFVAIKNGVEICWFDCLAVTSVICCVVCCVVMLGIVLFNRIKEKKK